MADLSRRDFMALLSAAPVAVGSVNLVPLIAEYDWQFFGPVAVLGGDEMPAGTRVVGWMAWHRGRKYGNYALVSGDIDPPGSDEVWHLLEMDMRRGMGRVIHG